MNVGNPCFEPMSCFSGGSRVVAYFVENYHCHLQFDEKFNEDCWHELEANWK